ncbi:hypothetical protein BGZ93_008758 [Podila epicladia]|nr:hypothetical protein BGZ92_007601 [Podila epicladia]KAG0091620.1 hypothetical protein BGZ93_008758 [Podila epicladia]
MNSSNQLMDHGFEIDYTIIDQAVSIWMDNGCDNKEVSVGGVADEFLGSTSIIASRGQQQQLEDESSGELSSVATESVGSQHQWIFKLMDRDSVVVVGNLIK